MIDAPIRRPVSKRTREAAAFLCAVRASGTSDAVDALAVWGSQEHRLADAAISLAWRGLQYQDACAEAEAMIRCGWLPGS